MYIFCTYCSRDKSKEPNPLPAIQRYQSARIEKVHNAASQVDLRFFILSGEFGLVPAQQPIPWYDHLLLAEEVDRLVERMIEQIHSFGISGVVYFTSSLTHDPNVRPYGDAITAACKRTSVPLSVIEHDMSD